MVFLQSRKRSCQLCVPLVIWLFRAQSRPEAKLTNLQKSMLKDCWYSYFAINPQVYVLPMDNVFISSKLLIV